MAGPKPALETSLTGSSQPALETPWSAFVAIAEGDLSPTVPIMLCRLGMLPAVSNSDPVRIAAAEATLNGTVADGTVVDGAPGEGAHVGGTSVGGTSLLGTSVGAAALYDPEPGAPALRPGPAPSQGGGRVRRAVRGLLMTPWFAASTGFVIAAGISLYSPHASITFPSAIGTIHCRQHGCTMQGGNGSGAPASSAPGQRLQPQGRRSEQSIGASRRTAGLKLTFKVLWHGRDSFGVAISISGKRSLGAWQLAFRLPGTHIQNVFGAEWVQSASGDGGTASPFQVDFGRAADRDEVSFQVLGSGRLGSPASCAFDGASCTFKVTHPGASGVAGSGGHRNSGQASP